MSEAKDFSDADFSDEEPCSLREVLGLVGDKWTMQILVRLTDGPRRFSELEHGIEGISRRMLALTLRGLERNGLVTRTVYAEVPARVEYSLSEHGRALSSVMDQLTLWGQAYLERQGKPCA